MSKHTPGPWETTGLRVNQLEDQHVTICDMPVWQPEFRAERLANARLIAAAPELLDVLIHIEEYWNRDQNETAMADALWHIISVAQEAIAKARGEV